ncbi:MAG TPA: flagellar basal body L-ring protein FlgH [Verrucomicrobiae bacterium]|jgi:flagellar L-ring protein precursor FlgH|nr:flagellar basal body L-ring protein FlgH [Verrucomicrobiae bacterium]
MKKPSLLLCRISLVALVVFTAQLATILADSLWKDDTSPASMFADKKAHRIGDILTVIVQENNGATRNNNTTTSKKSAVDASIASFLYGPASSGLLTKGGKYPAMSFSSANTFNGGGTIANSETINSMIAVKVIDVLPNGNLVIEGRRQTAFSGEKQDAILRGLVRRDDISATNSVYSVNIADATIQFISHGGITDNQRKGWFNRVWDKVSPF